MLFLNSFTFCDNVVVYSGSVKIHSASCKTELDKSNLQQ